MNYLAHIYLSGSEKKTIVGNFIGDHIKGKKYKDYPEEIQKGIILHRQIDTFTDRHKKFRESKKLLNGSYGLHSGIVVDLFFDHLLARNWHFFSDESLRSFTKKIHAILLSHFFILPKKVQNFLPFLIQNRRLESYATVEGIQKSLEIMGRYTSLPSNTSKAIETLKKNSQIFEENFFSFMEEMIGFIESEFEIQINRP